MSLPIILTNVNNPNKIYEFKTKTDATKYINEVTNNNYDRKTIYNYIDKNIPFENFIVSFQLDINKDNFNDYLFYEFKTNNEFNGKKIRITTKLPSRVSICDIISVIFNIQLQPLNKKYNEIIKQFPYDCNIYKFKGCTETCVVNAKSLIKIINSFDDCETINIFRNTCLNDLINYLEPIIITNNDINIETNNEPNNKKNNDKNNEPNNEKTSDNSYIINKKKTLIEFIFNDYNNQRIRITNNNPKKVCIYDILSIIKNTNNPQVKYEKLIKKYPDIEKICEIYKFIGKNNKDTPITDAKGIKKIVDLLTGKLVIEFKEKHIFDLINFLNLKENDNIIITDVNMNNNNVIITNLDDNIDENIINKNVIITNIDDKFIVNKNKSIIEFVFNDNNEFNGKKLRITNEIPKRVSIYDVISVVNNTVDARKVYKRLIIEYPEVVTNCHNFKFNGKGQRDTPITDAKGLIKIINLLSGPLAAKFRESCSNIIVKFLGGDLTLIDQIKTNNEIQQQLPENHPAKIFDQTNNIITNVINNKVMIEKKRIDYELKSPNMIGKSISDYKDKYIIYLIQFNQNNIDYIKFGISDDSIDRIEHHLKTLPNPYVWCMIETKDNKKIEDTLKLNMKHKNKLINLIVNNNNQTEILENIDPIHVEEHIYKLIKDIENCDYVKLQLAYIDLEKQKLDNEKYKLDNEKELKLKEYDNQIKLKEIEMKMKLFDNINKLTPELLKFFIN